MEAIDCFFFSITFPYQRRLLVMIFSFFILLYLSNVIMLNESTSEIINFITVFHGSLITCGKPLAVSFFLDHIFLPMTLVHYDFFVFHFFVLFMLCKYVKVQARL